MDRNPSNHFVILRVALLHGLQILRVALLQGLVILRVALLHGLQILRTMFFAMAVFGVRVQGNGCRGRERL